MIWVLLFYVQVSFCSHYPLVPRAPKLKPQQYHDENDINSQINPRHYDVPPAGPKLIHQLQPNQLISHYIPDPSTNHQQSNPLSSGSKNANGFSPIVPCLPTREMGNVHNFQDFQLPPSSFGNNANQIVSHPVSQAPAAIIPSRTYEYKPLLPAKTPKSSHPGQSRLYLFLAPPSGSLEELKNDIFDSLKHSVLVRVSPRPLAAAINLKSFIFELSMNEFSKFQTAETHLNWFVEFVTTKYCRFFHENILDYFDYILKYHLNFEIETSKRAQFLVDAAISRLIFFLCLMPEVISDLLLLLKDSFLIEHNCERHYKRLLHSISLHEAGLSHRGIERFLTVIEASISIVPIPSAVILLERFTRKHLRRVLHYAPVYKILLAFDAGEDAREDLSRALRLLDSSLYQDFTDHPLDFKALDTIFKRVYLHLFSSESEDLEEFVAVYETAAFQLVSNFQDFHIYDMIAHNYNYLLDVFVLYNCRRSDNLKVVDFFLFVKIAHRTNRRDTFSALKQVAIYLSIAEMKLETFRSEHKANLVACSEIGSDFILVLEALIAAVDEVGFDPAYKETWEPSREFLELQEEIYNLKEIKDSSSRNENLLMNFLFLASKIFLSRQTGYQISLFFSENTIDGFSWSEAIDFVNFYFGKYRKVESKFCEELKKAAEFKSFVDYGTVWRILD